MHVLTFKTTDESNATRIVLSTYELLIESTTHGDTVTFGEGSNVG